MGGSGEVVIVPGYAALINSDEIVDVLVETAEEVLEANTSIQRNSPVWGWKTFHFSWKRQEEFSIIWDAPTGKKALQPLHSQDFDIDEECLKLGVQLQAQLALKLLKRDIA